MNLRPSQLHIDLPKDFDMRCGVSKIRTWSSTCQDLATIFMMGPHDRGNALIMLVVEMIAPYGTDHDEADKAFEKFHEYLVNGIRERDQVIKMAEAEEKEKNNFNYQPERAS